jgi:hypothetical protein
MFICNVISYKICTQWERELIKSMVVMDFWLQETVQQDMKLTWIADAIYIVWIS